MPGVIAWNNLVDTATLSVTAGAGTDVVTLENLKDRRLAKQWKRNSTSGSTITLKIQFAEEQDIRYVAALNAGTENPSIFFTYADITLRAAGGAVLYNTSNYFANGYTAGHDDKMYRNIPRNAFMDCGQNFTNVFSIDVTLNIGRLVGGAAILSLGRLWASGAFLFPIGMDKGWSQQIISPESKITRSRSNQVYARRSAAYRQTSFKAGIIDTESVYPNPPLSGNAWRATLQQLAFETGSGQECIMQMSTDSSTASNIQTVYGSMTKPINYQSLAGPYFSADFEHTEER